MGEYADSLKKTTAPKVTTSVRTAPKAAAPVVEKPRAASPAPVSAPVTTPVATPPAAAVRAQAAETVVEQRAPIVSTQAPPPASPSIISRVGNFLADYGKAAMSPLTEMAVIPAAEGLTQGVAGKSGYSGQVTMSPEAKAKLNPFVDPETGRVDRTSQALTGASMVGGAAAGAAVGKYLLPAAGRAVSSRVSRMADIPDPMLKFQGGTSTLPASTQPLVQGASAAQKAKATLAAGLAANPASAGARAAAQDVAVVPRSVVSRMTRELGAGPSTNLTTRGAQFAIPNATRESMRAEIAAASASRAASRRAAAVRATRADARDAASRLTGSAAGAAISGFASSTVPDSSIAAITNNAASSTIKKVTQPSTADRIAQTRAEDLAPTINAVKNPFNNSLTGSTSTSNVSNPNPPEGPGKYDPIIPVDNFKGGVGQQDVLLKKVF